VFLLIVAGMTDVSAATQDETEARATPAEFSTGDATLDQQLDQLRQLTLRLDALAETTDGVAWLSSGVPSLPSPLPNTLARAADRLGQELMLLEHASLALRGFSSHPRPRSAEHRSHAVRGTEQRSTLDLAEAAEPINLAFEIENVGTTAIVNPRLSVGGGPTWFDMDSLLTVALAGTEGDEQRAVALWQFLVDSRSRGDPASDLYDLHDPVRLLNVFGYGYCDDAAEAYAVMVEALGMSARVWWLNGHVVPEVQIDGRWAMLDPDGEAYYRHPETGLILGVEQLAENIELLGTPVIPAGRSKALYPFATVAPLFGSQEDNLARSPRAPAHIATMSYVLLPGDVLTLSWHHSGWRFANNRYRPPNRWGNGRFTGHRSLDISVDSKPLSVDLPYALLAGRARSSSTAPSPPAMTVFARATGQAWVALTWTRDEDSRWTLPLTDALPLGMAIPAYSILLRVEPSGSNHTDASLELELELIVQVAPRSLPALHAGANEVLWNSDSPDGRAIVRHYMDDR